MLVFVIYDVIPISCLTFTNKRDYKVIFQRSIFGVVFFFLGKVAKKLLTEINWFTIYRKHSFEQELVLTITVHV